MKIYGAIHSLKAESSGSIPDGATKKINGLQQVLRLSGKAGDTKGIQTGFLPGSCDSSCLNWNAGSCIIEQWVSQGPLIRVSLGHFVGVPIPAQSRQPHSAGADSIQRKAEPVS